VSGDHQIEQCLTRLLGVGLGSTLASLDDLFFLGGGLQLKPGGQPLKVIVALNS